MITSQLMPVNSTMMTQLALLLLDNKLITF